MFVQAELRELRSKGIFASRAVCGEPRQLGRQLREGANAEQEQLTRPSPSWDSLETQRPIRVQIS